MQIALLAMSAFACSGSGARCRYVNRICPSRSIAHSAGCGSFTFTIISAHAKTVGGIGAIVAPAAVYASSCEADARAGVVLDHHLVARARRTRAPTRA